MKKLILSITFSSILLSLEVIGQTVFIPDMMFKQCLVLNDNINTNGDSEIQVIEANEYEGMISCGSENISDFTGIEAFTSLTDFVCYDNPATHLDLSSNVNLKTLICSNLSLTNLDVSSNVNLKTLICSNNSLTNLDVGSNINLAILNCSNNSLTNLDVRSNINLTILNCSNNSLTNLDVSTNINLEVLNCSNNALTNLDVSAKIDLTDKTLLSTSLQPSKKVSIEEQKNGVYNVILETEKGTRILKLIANK